MKSLPVLLAALALAGSASAAEHACAGAAREKAAKLLRFHVEEDGLVKLKDAPSKADPGEQPGTFSWNLDEAVVVPDDDEGTDRLRITGHVWRSRYDMSFVFVTESCELIAQTIALAE